MLHTLFVLLALQPSCFAAIYTLHRIRPLKHPWIYCSLTLATMDLLWIINQVLLPQSSSVISFAILFAGFFYLPFFAQDGHKIHALFGHAILMTMTLVLIILTEHILTAICPVFHVDPRRLLNMDDPIYLIVVLVNALIVIPALFIFSHFMRKLVVASPGGGRLAWFIVIPLSQTALMFIVNQHLEYSSSPRVWAFVVSGTVLCITADLACILGYRKYHELDEMAFQVRNAEQQLNTQREYYHEMQENILRINQIRHDLNNQLKTAYYLLEQGHPEEVRQQLDTLKSCISDHVGTQYCDNLMVDAVLREKAGLCQAQQIPLELDALVPADIRIDNAHLCSTFSNLLDNCIAAAKKAGSGSGPIRLRSDIHKGYLVIACSNPSVPPSFANRTDIMRRHGLGLEILSKLAGLHNGSFETDYRSGRFYVTMMLKNE